MDEYSTLTSVLLWLECSISEICCAVIGWRWVYSCTRPSRRLRRLDARYCDAISIDFQSSNTQYEHQLPVTGAVLNEMLEFVYTDTVTKTVHKKELTFWCR